MKNIFLTLFVSLAVGNLVYRIIRSIQINSSAKACDHISNLWERSRCHMDISDKLMEQAIWCLATVFLCSIARMITEYKPETV